MLSSFPACAVVLLHNLLMAHTHTCTQAKLNTVKTEIKDRNTELSGVNTLIVFEHPSNQQKLQSEARGVV